MNEKRCLWSNEASVDDDGLVSVTGHCWLIKIPPNGKIPVSFDKVDGYFKCVAKNLATLQGVPQIIINGFMDCYNNKLMTLEHSPPSMNNHDFDCNKNPLIKRTKKKKK